MFFKYFLIGCFCELFDIFGIFTITFFSLFCCHKCNTRYRYDSPAAIYGQEILVICHLVPSDHFRQHQEMVTADRNALALGTRLCYLSTVHDRYPAIYAVCHIWKCAIFQSSSELERTFQCFVMKYFPGIFRGPIMRSNTLGTRGFSCAVSGPGKVKRKRPWYPGTQVPREKKWETSLCLLWW